MGAKAKGMKTVRLGEIFRERKEKGIDGLPVMSVTMGGGIVARESLGRRVASELRADQHSLARKGDIAYNMMRMWQGVSGLASQDCIVSPAYVVLEPSPDLDSQFAAYLLKSESTIQQLHRFSQGVTDDRLRLYFEQLKPIEVRLPPRAIQVRIAKILASVDDAIEATRAVIDQSRRLKDSLLAVLLTNGLPGRHSAFTTNGKTGRVPSDWVLKTLDELVTTDRPICYGILMPGRGHKNGVPVIKVKDIRDGKVDESQLLLTSPAIDEEFRRSRLQTGDLLITIRGTTGRVAIVPDSLDAANITQDTARVSIADETIRDFVYYALQTRQLQDQIAHNTIGQAVKGINLEEVRKLTIAIPTPNECRLIVQMFHSIELRLNTESDYFVELSKLKNALSQGLLTGRIPVQEL